MNTGGHGRTARQRATAAAAIVLVLGWAVAARGAAPPGPGAGSSAPPTTLTVKDLEELLSRLVTINDLYKLPEHYRRADGTINQDVILETQKKRLDPINRRLTTKLRMAETAHYLLFSDTPPATTALFVKWSEALFGNLCAQFGIDPKERIWDGKLVLMLFNQRVDFEAYSQAFDDHSATGAGAYFAVESRSVREPQLIHLCIPVTERDVRRLQELFAHEGTHAFFELYRKPGGLPRWLHEGMAEYMTTVNDPSLRPQKIRPAGRMAASQTNIDHVLRAQTAFGLDWDDYSVAFTLVDFLLTAGKPKFRKFIEGLKDGKDQDAALQDAYGFGVNELERRWQPYVNEYLLKRR